VGFCFAFAALRVCGPLKKLTEEPSFLAPPQKAALGLTSRPHSSRRAGCPARTRGRKGGNTVSEEIKTSQTAEETSAVEPGERADTASALWQPTWHCNG
jgi:hypothetical protein